MLRIDLGCGMNKQAGFIGVDRYPLTGVDVVADMNQTLPFRDDSVDLLLASHSLEHVETLLTTMRDVYRICKHGTQLCIVAPYSEQKLNWANPYHKCAFNEHTPRFWTDYPNTPVDPREYHHPHAFQWGLSKTDNSKPGIDIRIVRMECFYFPRYAGLPHSEQRRLRHERTDVCDQIMYHLIVWKGDPAGRGRPFDDYVAEFQPYEPEYITQRRNRGPEMSFQDRALEREDARERQYLAAEAQISEGLRQELKGAKDEGTQLRAHSVSLIGEITRLHEHCALQTAALGRLTTELQDTAAHNRTLRDEAVKIERDLEFARAELRRESGAAIELLEQVSSLKRQNHDLKANLESNEVLRAKLGLTRAELETTATLLGLLRQKEEALSGETASARSEAAVAAREAERWKALWSAAKKSLSALTVEPRISEFTQVARVGGFIIGRDRQIQGLPDGFGPLREYCDRHFSAARACIVLGGNLAEVPYREYVIPFSLDRLSAVSFAIRPMIPESSGVLGIEIVSSRSEILAHLRRELTTIPLEGVTEFRLPIPLTGLEKNWCLRVFARDVATPVSVYELVRAALIRGTTQSFPLVSFN
uniref:Methyltransferase type 11 n=1 Tax=Solibacter usitatus (strain Ellin6076) TaxID=234267 RepID=Q01R66_SOLUE